MMMNRDYERTVKKHMNEQLNRQMKQLAKKLANLARLLYVKKSTIEEGEDSGGSAVPATPPPNKKN